MNKHLLLSLTGLILSISVSFAQQKIKDGTITGTNLPNKDAILELESNDKGFLHVRIALVATINPAPLTAHVAGMMVYNTATSADVTPGIYYNDGTKWVKNAAGVAGPKGDKGDAGLTGPQGIQGLKGDAGPIGLIGPKGDVGATGLVGPQGIQGLKGDAGTIGLIGPKGDTGATGLTGSAGVTGDKGDTGAQGIQGLKGDVGATGAQGVQGLKGDTGATGLTGATGDKGDTGATGLTGATGDKGDKGDVGLTGATGAQGPIGAPGSQGATGITGSQGIQGLKGDTGDKGDKGDVGATGSQGATGITGSQGIQGLKGDTGDKGDIGATGVTGSQGIQGLKGDTGDKGDIGATGVTGSQGIQGLKGDTGDKGDKGDIGATGAAGSQGIQGLKGDTGDKGDVGATGSQGIQGLKGDTGDKGDRGDTGATGASTPQTITHTLSSVDNTLTSDVNGIAPTAKLINSNVLGLDVTNNLTSTINGVPSNAVNLSILTIEPWNIQNTTNKATLNTDNIFQTGSVAIGKNLAATGVSLDVRGAIRGGGIGGLHTGTIGQNSVAFGSRNEASGITTTAFGISNIVAGSTSFSAGVSNNIDANSRSSMTWGEGNKLTLSAGYGYGTAWGYLNTISGPALLSTVFGQYNAISATLATAFGNSNIATGTASTVFGSGNTASSENETVFGRFNAIKIGSTQNIQTLTDPLLQVGNGSTTLASNALTILKNGKTGIGIVGIEAAAKPTELLDLGGAATATNGGLRIRNINSAAYAGAVTDNLVVADANGILKTLTSSTLITEPFQVESTTTKATTNTQNIYQNGNVGIGDFSTTNPIAKLDVRGAMRSGTPHADELSGASVIGSNSAALGMSNKATGNYSVAGGWNNMATGIASIAFGVGNSALANDAFASGSGNTVELGANNSLTSGYANIVKANAWSSFVTGQENTINKTHGFASGYLNNVNGNVGTAFGFQNTSSSPAEFVLGVNNAVKTGTPDNHILTDALFQVGNGFVGSNNALTILKNAHTAIGLTGTEATAKPTELLDLGGAATATNGGLRIRNINSAAYTGDITIDKMVVADATGVLKTVTFAMNTTNIVNIATAYTTLADDYTIIADAETAGFTLTIPAAAPANKGRILVIRKIDESSNDLTFSQGIKISKTVTITTLNINSTMRIQSDGTNWYKID